MIQQSAADSAAGTGILESLEEGFWEFANTPIVSFGDTSVTPAGIGAAVLVVILGWFLSLVIQRIVTGALRRKDVTDVGVTGTASRLIHYAIMIVAVLTALPMVGVDVTGLFAAGAIAAVAIGFALQQILQNFVAGVLLLMERTITPGDVLEVNGQMVRVVDMRIRSTIARTRDEEEIILPNSELVQSSVKNYTLRDTQYRLRTRIGVDYGSDVDQVLEVLIDAAKRVPDRDTQIEPLALFLEFADSALLFDVSIWVQDPWATRATRSTLNREIWWALKQAGIKIPFPQMDVHVDGTLTREDG